MRTHRWMAGLALGASCLVACGGAGGSPRTSAEQSETESTPAQGSTPGATEQDWGRGAQDDAAGTEPACYDKCAEWIRRADGLFAQAQARPQGTQRAPAFRRAGEAYVVAWRGCSLAIPHGQDLGCQGAATVVPRMVESFDQSEDDAQRVFAHLVAMDRRWRQDASSTPSPVLRELAERAERQAGKTPKDAVSIAGLAAATHARIALGDGDGAMRNLARYRQLVGKDTQEEGALLGITVAAHFNDRGAPSKAASALGSAPENPSPRVAILWYAEQGRAQAGMKREAAAKSAFTRVVQTYEALPKDASLAQQLGRAQPHPMQGRERVVEGVGAAHFHAAEVLRARAGATPWPRYTGPKTVQGVTVYINEQIGPYVRQRQQRLLEADEAYRNVSEIKPVPPIRYVAASAGSVGAMWAALADDVLTAPVPPHVAADESLAAGYRKTLEESMAPIQDKARRAFTICRDAAREARLEGDFVDACDRWLRDHPAP